MLSNLETLCVFLENFLKKIPRARLNRGIFLIFIELYKCRNMTFHKKISNCTFENNNVPFFFASSDFGTWER